jgi:hypothetical protein
MKRDYWIAATVRSREAGPQSPYSLWTVRIKANDLLSARLYAIELLNDLDLTFAELRIMWDTTEAVTVPDKHDEAEQTKAALLAIEQAFRSEFITPDPRD